MIDPLNNFLTEDNTDRNPFGQFSKWYKMALESGFLHPNAMTLATADKTGNPSARIVLLKDFDENGFVFFTNFESRKGIELMENPQASLLFYWDRLDKQIRIEGKVGKVSEKESADYFYSRPRGSQLGASVSPQSRIIKSRGELDEKFKELEETYKGAEIPLPKNWGGFRLKPEYFEFWQSRENRLHDRIAFRLENNLWKMERLAP